jgi:oxygen-independent coproporphyrinogen-3 oxidase
VNRLSIGAQSFNDQHLNSLGRIHRQGEIHNAYNAARRAGFHNINLDLMHGLPQQTPSEAENDLLQAIELAPEHISWYQLTIEPNTGFYSAPPRLPQEDALADIQDIGQALLAKANYHQYEVSAFAKGGQKSEHNLNYWRFGDYLAIGAGAHGKISTVASSGSNILDIYRYQKTRSPKDYLTSSKKIAVSKQPLYGRAHNSYCSQNKLVAESEIPLEFMMNALRLIDGVKSVLYEQRSGQKLTSIDAILNQLRAKNLLENNKNRLQLSRRGQLFLNEVLEAFLS